MTASIALTSLFMTVTKRMHQYDFLLDAVKLMTDIYLSSLKRKYLLLNLPLLFVSLQFNMQ